MSYVFQVVKKPRTYWDGKIGYLKSDRSRSNYGWSYNYSPPARKVLEDIKDDWRPSFTTRFDDEIVESDLRKAKRLITHYNVQRMRKGNSTKFPELVLRRIDYKPTIKEKIATTGLDQLREASRINEQFGATMAESYARLTLPDKDLIFEVAVKRKGRSIDAVRDLGKGYSHGMFTFFKTKGEYVHARLALGDKIDRIYYLQDPLNKNGEAAL